MSIKGMITIIVGVIGFAIIYTIENTLITGTDSGSTFLRAILLVVVAAVIVIGAILTIAGATSRRH